MLVFYVAKFHFRLFPLNRDKALRLAWNQRIFCRVVLWRVKPRNKYLNFHRNSYLKLIFKLYMGPVATIRIELVALDFTQCGEVVNNRHYIISLHSGSKNRLGLSVDPKSGPRSFLGQKVSHRLCETHKQHISTWLWSVKSGPFRTSLVKA